MTRWEEWLASESAARDAAGLQRTLRPRAAEGATTDLAGNDYLGLSRDPAVVEAAAAAARRWGAGAGASRLVTGTLELHAQLERELAAYLGQPAALVFSTGYHANLAAVAALGGRDALVVSDAHVHASLVDAVRLSKADVEIVPHHDVAAVESSAGRGGRHAVRWCWSSRSTPCSATRRRWSALAAVCERYDALLVVDEAHGLGVRGPGLVRELGLAGLPHVLVTATLSKALGSQGGAVLGPQAVVDHLVNRARPFVFDTGLAPAAAGAALEALRQLRARPELSDVVRRRMTDLAAALGVAPAAGAVLSVPMPSPLVALAAQATALAQGVTVGCFRPPSVPDGISRLRITVSAGIPEADWARAVDVLVAVVKEHAVRVLVVTGTSTGVGKTVATAALAATATGSVLVVKPVQTGALDGDSDAREVARLTGVEAEEWTTLDEPLAPDTAARRQGVDVPAVASYAARIAVLTQDTVIVEGAGGLLVRLDAGGGTLLDLASLLAGVAEVEVVVVVAAGLGTLNHTELTVDALRARGLTVRGLVIGAWPAEPDLAERCNLDDLQRIAPLLAVIPEGAGALDRDAFVAAAPGWFGAGD